MLIAEALGTEGQASTRVVAALAAAAAAASPVPPHVAPVVHAYVGVMRGRGSMRVSAEEAVRSTAIVEAVLAPNPYVLSAVVVVLARVA